MVRSPAITVTWNVVYMTSAWFHFQPVGSDAHLLAIKTLKIVQFSVQKQQQKKKKAVISTLLCFCHSFKTKPGKHYTEKKKNLQFLNIQYIS